MTDGAALVVLCSKKYKKEKKLELPYIKGFGHRVAPMWFQKKIEDNRESKYVLPWTRQAVKEAYERAGLTVEDGRVRFDGAKPINPSGGLIGCGHPVGATGVRMMLDLYKQLSKKAGKYQVKDTRNAMMLNIGGTATTNYVFIAGV